MAGEAANPKEFVVPGAVKANEGEENSREAQKWVVYSTREVVHLVVQDDAIRGHDR